MLSKCYFCYRGEDCLGVCFETMNKILDNFAYFPRKIKMNMTDDENREYETKEACYLCGDEFNQIPKKF